MSYTDPAVFFHHCVGLGGQTKAARCAWEVPLPATQPVFEVSLPLPPFFFETESHFIVLTVPEVTTHSPGCLPVPLCMHLSPQCWNKSTLYAKAKLKPVSLRHYPSLQNAGVRKFGSLFPLICIYLSFKGFNWILAVFKIFLSHNSYSTLSSSIHLKRGRERRNVGKQAIGSWHPIPVLKITKDCRIELLQPLCETPTKWEQFVKRSFKLPKTK